MERNDTPCPEKEIQPTEELSAPAFDTPAATQTPAASPTQVEARPFIPAPEAADEMPPQAEAPAAPAPGNEPGGLMTAARILSAIFTPFMVPFVAFFLLFFFTYLRIMPLQYKLIVLGIVYCFTILMPMLFIYLYQRLSGEGLRALGERRKRFIPYALTLTSYLACLFTLYRLHMPRYLSGILVAALLCMIGCTMLNFRWKVSTHTASSGLLIGGLLSYSFLFQFNPVGWLSIFILLAGLLGSARIIVKQHTLLEVFAGFMVGLFCGVIGILFI